MNETKEKPPIGLMSKAIWESKCNGERLRQILDAMRRYTGAGKPCPIEWIDELEVMFL